MNKHTPAPWYTTNNKEIVFDDETIRITERPHYGGMVIASVWNNDAQQANARLIAAAPELLEALKLTWAIVDGMRKPGINLYVDPATVEAVESALAKAEPWTAEDILRREG